MSPEAVSARLREMARLLQARGLRDKGPDMSRDAVTARLQTMAALSEMCRRLRNAGLALRPVARKA